MRGLSDGEMVVSADVMIRHLSSAEVEAHIPGLSDVLMDCVDGGASVSFMTPLSRAKAEAFWRGIAARVAAGETELLVATLDSAVVGTVQLVMALPENQPHRADLAKMLVHRDARKKGVGHALLSAAEAVALKRGKTLLVLDTASDEAERLYQRQGWQEVGRVPDYALFPDGRPCDTMIFYKRLSPS